jgi:Rieske Fe-S protein
MSNTNTPPNRETNTPKTNPKHESPRHSTRRGFLKTALTASVFAATGTKDVLGEVMGVEYTDKKGSLAGLFTMQFKDYPALRTVGGSVRIEVNGLVTSSSQINKGIMVTRANTSTITAVLEDCTHEHCAINMYNPNTQKFVCGCHQSQYDVTGKVLQGPANRALTSYTVTFNTANDFVQLDLPGVAVAVKDKQDEVQSVNTLLQSVPNPTTGYTTIEYSVNKAAHVGITLYSALGKELTKIVDKFHEAGSYKTIYDASNLSRGVYFYRMETSTGFSQTRKLTVSE